MAAVAPLYVLTKPYASVRASAVNAACKITTYRSEVQLQCDREDEQDSNERSTGERHTTLWLNHKAKASIP